MANRNELVINKLKIQTGADVSGTGTKLLTDNSPTINGNTVIGVGGTFTLDSDPSSALHAATKQYVDSVATGLDVKKSLRAATTGALPAVTYNNGTSGVGATLTADANGALPSQDGISLSLNDRLLVKNQVSALQNGIYTVTQLGDGSNPFILTRATDADSASEVSSGLFTFIEEGTVNADSGWVLTTDGAVTMGTTALTFSQFSGAGQIEAGAGLTKSGNTLNVETASSSRIVVNADNIDLALTGVSAGTFTKLTVDLYGRVTVGASATTTDIAEGTNLYYTDTRFDTRFNTKVSGTTDALAMFTGTNTLGDSPLSKSGTALFAEVSEISGKADDTTNLGSTTRRFATLFMASVIDIASGSSLQIGHATNALVVHSSDRILIGTATDDGSNLLQVNGSTKLFDNLTVVKGINALTDNDVSNIGNLPTWVKYTVSHTALQVAALTNNITLLSLPAGCIIHMIKVKHTTAFAGTGITAYSVSVGVAGDLARYVSAFDVFQAVAGNTQQLSTVNETEDHDAATSIKIAATSVGANLDQSTAGSVDIYVLVSKAKT